VLSRDDLLTLYERLGLSDEARSVIDHVRSSDPARRVGSGRGNVSGRYPSKKMGITIQFESHRVELAAIYEMENDAHVLEYFKKIRRLRHSRCPGGWVSGGLEFYGGDFLRNIKRFSRREGLTRRPKETSYVLT
jgi:hypothetical protein